ncbi:MAG: hypothetical protein M3167_10260 [Acidobacteriota bacterium]|nr:hypothetical protein [Acidobacteriota bacterium]
MTPPPPLMTPPPPLDLEDARRRLRDLGYLQGRVERYVFARALQGRGGLFLPAVLLGAFAGALACLAAVAAGEPGFLNRPAAPAVLLVHLFCAFLAPAAVLAWLAGLAAHRVRSPAVAAMAIAAASALAIFFLWIGGAWRLSRGIPEAALLWGLPVAIGALLAARSVRAGFLASAYARSGELPASGGRGALFGVAAAGLLVAAGVFASREAAVPAPPLHVSARRPPLVVVALDGVGDGVGAPSGSTESANPLEALLARGATGWWPSDAGSPPELWSTVATGVPSARHGVRALERVRPAGSPTALRPPLGAAWYLRRIAPALKLATSAPVSDADRSALAFWEVSASAGLPTAAIGWWASGPWPGADVVDNRQVLARARTGEEADGVALEELSRRAGAAIATAYLPGPDILRREPARRAAEIARIAGFLKKEAARAAGGGSVLVVLTAESHPGANSLGRATVFDGRSPTLLRIRAVDVAPSLLARAGIPVAEDLAGRPVPALFREDSLETLTVPTYGARLAPAAAVSPTSDREYLKKLRSLGYLN